MLGVGGAGRGEGGGVGILSAREDMIELCLKTMMAAARIMAGAVLELPTGELTEH